ncbi:hypothetical protein [Terrabacter sp. MAHUQ-38]|uniref:hypothetical protein n=1 Tax=unclassified Terrabacter TaxID=2630222 RepID=UPI00165DA884|nr:hypothetical protein [Terrabacter sp. MAHUQ-38]MBC9821925.1 hypothetical protein [Terrabacter sp. MAHUQ-38]
MQAPSPNSAVVVTSTAISGSRALKVTDSSSSTGVLVAQPKFAVTAGRQYHLQGYSYTVSGAQALSLVFFDAAGTVVGRSSVASTGASMVWSRVETRAVAPATARSASIQISSSAAATGQMYWDAVMLLAPIVPNGGFELPRTLTAPVPQWTTTAGVGVSAASSSPGRVGASALVLQDSSSVLSAAATSAPISVFPGVSHDVRVWVLANAGSVGIAVKWYGPAAAYLGSTTVPSPTSPRSWSQVYARVTAPYGATTARVVLSTSSAGTSTARADDVQLTPTAGSPVTSWTSGSLGEPLDSFANSTTLDATTIGGRATLFGIVAGEPAELQFADVQSGVVTRRVPLPGLSVGWGLAQAPNGLIYAAGTGGHLYEVDPAGGPARDVGKPAAGASMIWDLEVDGAGRIVVATYPDAHLAVYDPSTGTSTDLGAVSSTDEYARSLAIVGDYAYVGVGSTDPCLVRVSLADPTDRQRISLPVPVSAGRVTAVEALGRYLLVQTPSGITASGATYSGERRLYDLRNRTWDVPANLYTQTPSGLDSRGSFYYISYQQVWAVDSTTGAKVSAARVTTPMGRDRLVYRGTLGGVTSEWLLSYDPVGTVGAIDLATYAERAYTVTFAPTKMPVKAIDEGVGGRLFVGGFGGSSLSVVDPATGARAQYPGAPSSASDAIGELEGSHAHGPVQYLGTYNDGKIFRYDPAQPWVEGSNPRLLANLGTTLQQDRPLAWTSSGDRTFFGTVPRYGVLGGALGIIPDDSSLPQVVPSPVVDQGIVSLAVSGNVVYGGTTRWGGIGATPTQSTAAVFAYDFVQRKLLWTAKPLSGAQAYGGLVLGPGSTLWAASGTRLVELDPRTGATRRQVMVYPEQVRQEVTYKNADLVYSGGLLYLAAGKVYAIDPLTLRVSSPVASGLTSRQLAVVGSRIYYAAGTALRWITPRL